MDTAQFQINDLFKNPSRWVPPDSGDKLFNSIISNINTFATIPTKRPRLNRNISRAEEGAIKNLAYNNTIVIKAADKGGATVIIDKADYHRSMFTILEDTETYKKVNHNDINVQILKNKVTKFVKENNYYFTKNEQNYLYTYEMNLAYMYGLPKVHKSIKLKELIEENKHIENNVFKYNFQELNIPFRPIVSGKHCPISRLCELAQLILKPFEKCIPHLIIDTNDFLTKLPKQIKRNTTLVAIDIVALYPSIENALGIEALKYWFDKWPNKFIKSFDKDFSIKLLHFIQNNVYMTFNDLIFKQIQGTAMGKQNAPPYANLVIAYLIMTKLYPSLENNYGQDAKEHIESNIKVFLDDGFIMLDEEKITASQLLELLNNMNKSIKFTMETSKTQIPFLDVLVKLKQNPFDATVCLIETDIYHKPTDSFNYFPFKSCAPKHITRNIPYNLSRRVATIVSNHQIRNTRFMELYQRLKNKGYPDELIADSIKTAKTLDRQKILDSRGIKIKNKKDDHQTITLVIDHNPNISDPSIKVKQICNELNNCEIVKSGKVKMPNIITSRRQPPNLLRTLSLNKKRDHTGSSNNNNSANKFTKCKDTRCLFCKENVISTESYKTCNGTTLKRNANMTCKTQDLIYLLVCAGCKKEYIGETGVSINQRTNLHRSHVKHEHYGKLKVSKHIRTCEQKQQFHVFPFYKCNKGCHLYREEMEWKWREEVRPELH